MPDVATIAAFITSIKNATDLAKAIKEAGGSLEKAEAKLKLADLMESLAEARIQAAEVQEILQAKDKKIAELEEAFKLKSKLVRSIDAYYEIDESGKPTGAPYCSHCWEVNHKTVHLHTDFPPIRKICPACKTRYDNSRVHSM
jgi:hypothetical protein